MSDLALDLNRTSPSYGDIVVENGDLAMIDGKAEIQQNVLQFLRTFREEWFLDITIGVPYYQQIFVKNQAKSKIDAIFIDEISKVPGVDFLLSYSSTLDSKTRSLVISFKASTVNGIIDYRGLVL